MWWAQLDCALTVSERYRTFLTERASRTENIELESVADWYMSRHHGV